MDRKLTNLLELLDQGLNRGLKHSVVGGAGHNRYTLNIDCLSAGVSVLQVAGNEQLNQPWHYTITFTSSNKHLSVVSFLNQNAHLTFNSASANNLGGLDNKGLKALNSLISSTSLDALKPPESLKQPEPLKQLDKFLPSNPLDSLNALTQLNPLNLLNSLFSQGGSRTLYGVVTEFSQLSVNKDEARYQVVLSSRLAKLALSHHCASLSFGDYAVKFICKDEAGKIYTNEPYIATLPDGRKVRGKTDKNGYTKAFYTQNENETITLEFINR